MYDKISPLKWQKELNDKKNNNRESLVPYAKLQVNEVVVPEEGINQRMHWIPFGE